MHFVFIVGLCLFFFILVLESPYKVFRFWIFFLQNHLVNFNQTWHKVSLGYADSGDFFFNSQKKIVYFFLLKGKNMALCRCIYGLELYFRCAMWQMGLLLWILFLPKKIILNLPSFTGNSNVSTCMRERS